MDVAIPCMDQPQSKTDDIDFSNRLGGTYNYLLMIMRI
jgi:hypothetical protein